MNKNVVTATDQTFHNEVLESPLPVLVDFWAPWCGPCRIVGPIVEELASEYAGRVKVVKLNTDENPDSTATFGIRGIPTLGFFRDGKLVDGIVGAASRKALKAKLDEHLAKHSVN
jgi:thioredoxin 1